MSEQMFPVKKSFVPGKGWKQVTRLSETERALLRGMTKLQLNHTDQATGLSIEGFRNPGPNGRYHAYRKDQEQLAAWLKTKKTKRVKEHKGVELGRLAPSERPNANATAVQLGGRKGRKVMLIRPGQSRHTLRHELAHVTPNRSSYRLFQIGSNPTKAMAEEARADMASGSDFGKQPQKMLPGDTKRWSGYSQMADNDSMRERHQAAENAVGGHPERFSPEAVARYRKIQHRIRQAKIKTPPPKDNKTAFKVGAGVAGATATGAAAVDINRHYSRDQRGRFTSGVAKSYVPHPGGLGGKYVKAAEMTAKERARAQMYLKQMGGLHRRMAPGLNQPGYRSSGPLDRSDLSQHYNSFRSHHAQDVKTAAGRKGVRASAKGNARRIELPKDEMPPNANAYAFKTGGRRGQNYIATQGEASPRTMAHEHSHTTPKRSSYRLWSLGRDGAKAMREEARADMDSGAYYGEYKKHPISASGYSSAAADEGERELAHHFDHNPNFPELDRFSPESVQAYREVQDKIHAAGGLKDFSKWPKPPKPAAARTPSAPKSAPPVRRDLEIPEDFLRARDEDRAASARSRRRRNLIRHTLAGAAGATAATGAAYAASRKYQRDRNGRFASSGVAKSYVPGVGWKAATKLSRAERAALRMDRYSHSEMARGLHERNYKNPGPDGVYNKFRDQQRQIRNLVSDGRKITPSQNMPGVHRAAVQHHELPPSVEAVAFHTGGRRGKRYMATKDGANRMVVNHELAHLAPKRDSYRLFNIISDPNKAMREEARADMAAGSDYKTYTGNPHTHSGYSGAAHDDWTRHLTQQVQVPERKKMFDREPVKGYKQTQDRIRDARAGKPYVSKPKTSTGTPQQPQQNPKRKVTWLPMAAAAGVGTAAAAAGGTMAYRKYRRDHTGRFASSGVSKGYTPWDGVHSLVSKSNPDVSDVHVLGNGRRLKKMKRPIYPDSVREVRRIR